VALNPERTLTALNGQKDWEVASRQESVFIKKWSFRHRGVSTGKPIVKKTSGKEGDSMAMRPVPSMPWL
jgi:hypothetical protein